MHAGAEHQPDSRLWLIAGTGEGPPLAVTLHERGWRLRICVVSPAAARAYPLEVRAAIRVGPLGDASSIAAALDHAALAGEAPRWVVDASHPFASRISSALASVCEPRGLGLLRLLRPALPIGKALVLADLEALRQVPLGGEALLLAIGARELSRAVDCSPGAVHHARILPNPAALAAAMAAGLMPTRVATLRPAGEAGIEEALCRRWGITSILCRRSGGAGEAHWHQLAAALGMRLLLLDRPSEPAGVPGLGMAELLARIGDP